MASASTGLTPLLQPDPSCWRMAPSLLHSPSLLCHSFSGSNRRGIQPMEEGTRLQLPAAEGSGTFQPHRMIWNHSNLAAETQSAVGPQPQSRADFHSYHTRFLDLPTQRSYTRAPLDWPAEKHAAFLQHPCKRDKEEDQHLLPLHKQVRRTDWPTKS